jgi:hypothetical protein
LGNNNGKRLSSAKKPFHLSQESGKGRILMPEMTVDIPIVKLAGVINNMNKREIETLYMFLTEEGSELLERNRDLKLKKVKYLTEEEVFDV